MNSKIAYVCVAAFVSTINVYAQDALRLSTAFEMALQNEPKLKSAKYQTSARLEAIEQVKSKLYPQIQGNVSWGRYEYEYLSSPKPVKENYTDYSISAVQPIFHPEYFEGIDQSNAQYKATEYQYMAQAQQLGLELAKGYFLVLRTEKNVELALSQKNYYEQKYKQLQEMLKFGLTNRIDLLETKVALDKSTSEWLIEQKRLQVAKLRLENMIGDKFIQLQTFDFKLLANDVVIGDRNEVAKKVESNFMIKASEHNVKSVHHDVEIRRYEHYPKVDFSLTRKETNSNDPISHIYDNQAVIRMSLPIYSGGYTQSRIKEGVLLLESAQQERFYYTQESKARFEEIWQEQEFLIEQLKELYESEASAKLYLESIEKGASAGIKSVVDVLEARAKVHQIKRDIVDAGYELINNRLTLLELTGELSSESIAQFENRYLKQ